MTYQAAPTAPDAGQVLEGMLARLPGTTGGVALSADGMPAAWRGLGRDQADRLAVTAAGLLAAGRAAGTALPGSGGTVHVTVELDGAVLAVCGAGDTVIVAVTAHPGSDLTALGRMVRQVAMGTRPWPVPARPPAPAPARQHAVPASPLPRRRPLTGTPAPGQPQDGGQRW